MNMSGTAVIDAKEVWNINNNDLIVIYDDSDLNIGKVRMRLTGSSAGHKGIKSIIDMLKTFDVPRLRIGIGRDNDAELSDYVLDKFSSYDEKRNIIEKGVSAVETIIKNDFASAMEIVNSRRFNE